MTKKKEEKNTLPLPSHRKRGGGIEVVGAGYTEEEKRRIRRVATGGVVLGKL